MGDHPNLESPAQIISLGMDLSIIIVNYNAAPLLKRAIDSIEDHLKNIQHEICVVDNASTDESSELCHRFPQIRFIRNDKNLGFATAVNRGLKNTTGTFILWLNPDAKLLDEGFEKILGYMNDHPEVGIIGPRIVNTDGTIQLSCRSFPTYHAGLFNRYSLLTKWFPQNRFSQKYLKSDWDHNVITDVDWVSGACLLHRRELMERPDFWMKTFSCIAKTWITVFARTDKVGRCNIIPVQQYFIRLQQAVSSFRTKQLWNGTKVSGITTENISKEML